MKNFIRIIFLMTALFTISNTSFAQSQNGESDRHTITVGALDEIDYTGSCTNGTDTQQRVYDIGFKGIGAGEKIRIISKGSQGRNWKYQVADLVASKTQLPQMTISGGLTGVWLKHGLWIERIKTGERHQLNRLPGSSRCNSKGQISVKFTNLWISVEATE